MTNPVIAILFGGCSTEYEVSLQSAYAVISHIDRTRFTPIPIGITREGEWYWYSGPVDLIPCDRWRQAPGACLPCVLSQDRTKKELLVFSTSTIHYTLDAAFPVLHGKNGEDGTVQGLLELAGIPIIGCGSLSSGLCMDKDRAHKLVSLAGIRTPQGKVISSKAAQGDVQQAAVEIGYPLFVKPVHSGSSIGITRVSTPEALSQAFQEAAQFDSEILLEESVPGFETGCAVMGNETLLTGLVDEIELSDGFFTYEEKYTLKTSHIHCPARISQEKAWEIQEAAKTVYRALNCQGFARIDLFLTPEGEIVFNEANTIPGFTAHSRYPNMMKGIGLDFGELVNRLIVLGVENR